MWRSQVLSNPEVMKIPFLFSKAAPHQRFRFSPRYYDVKKEEMQNREDRIKRELSMDANADLGDFRSRIAGSFQAVRKRNKPTGGSASSNLLRLGVLLYLVLLIIAYLTWGNIATYSLLLFVPFYFYLKFKKR